MKPNPMLQLLKAFGPVLGKFVSIRGALLRVLEGKFLLVTGFPSDNFARGGSVHSGGIAIRLTTNLGLGYNKFQILLGHKREGLSILTDKLTEGAHIIFFKREKVIDLLDTGRTDGLDSFILATDSFEEVLKLEGRRLGCRCCWGRRHLGTGKGKFQGKNSIKGGRAEIKKYCAAFPIQD
jgi:hypothetical protein